MGLFLIRVECLDGGVQDHGDRAGLQIDGSDANNRNRPDGLLVTNEDRRFAVLPLDRLDQIGQPEALCREQAAEVDHARHRVLQAAQAETVCVDDLELHVGGTLRSADGTDVDLVAERQNDRVGPGGLELVSHVARLEDPLVPTAAALFRSRLDGVPGGVVVAAQPSRQVDEHPVGELVEVGGDGLARLSIGGF